ncbi:MAG: antibiotic biosynthesis monooxygenase family protein [Thermodesulfobacteriota bacterium]
MSRVVLINPFEVPKGKEEECLAFWEKAAAYMKRQPGFISTRLHRALSSEARFHFINIAEWESAAHFQAAVGSEEFQQLIKPYMERCPHYPGLYEVIRT